MKRLLLTIIIITFATTFFGETFTLNCDEAVSTAIENNLMLKKEEIGLKTKKRAKDSLWNQFLPSIKFSPGFSMNLIDSTLPDIMIADKDSAMMTSETDEGTMYFNTPVSVLEPSSELPNWAVSMGISAQLPLNAAMFTGIEVTRQDYFNGIVSYETAVAQLKRDVKKSYYNLIFLQQLISLFEQNLETATKRYEQALIKFNNGYLPKLQLLTAQAMVENIKPQIIGQKHLYQVSIMNFKIYLGLSFTDTLELSENGLEVFPIKLNSKELIDKNLKSRLDIRFLMGNIDYLKKSKTSFLVGQLSPSVLFGISYNASQSIYLEDKPDDLDWRENSSLTIGFSLPIDQMIPGSKTWVKAKAMGDSIDALKIQLQNGLRMAELDIRRTVMNIDKSWQNIGSLNFNVELNSEVYSENERGYNVGQIDILDLEDAEDSLKQAKIDLIREKVTYLSTLVDLEYALNLKLDEIKENEGEKNE